MRAGREDRVARVGPAKISSTRATAWEVEILNITERQIMESLIAVPAFMPATLCSGYVVAWSTDLYGFRSRTVVERIFWSVPLSLCVTTISSILISKFLSLETVVVLLWAVTATCLGLSVREWARSRGLTPRLCVGWKPYGNAALLLALLWIVIAIGCLVDLQSGHSLYASLTIFDHSMRVSWVESVMRTGVPPMNPLYMDQHPAPMRYYYFWYVLCAAIAKMWHLPARAVMTASCVWAGYAVVALAGLYTKHFLEAGKRTRRQVLRVCGLMTVTGLGVLVNVWSILNHTRQLPGDLEIWRAGEITSWFNSMLWVPHHVASMVCCMTGFLTVWIACQNRRQWIPAVGIAAIAFASSFGLSVYVAFTFFLVALACAGWMALSEKNLNPGISLGVAGVLAAGVLIPFLLELTHDASGKQGGTSVFSFAIRETIPPEDLLRSSFFQHIAVLSPSTARNLANLALLVPGYTVELGFYFAVLLIYIFPMLRDRKPLTAPQKSLVCLSIATLVLMSIVRSNVLEVNDFGWRAAFLLQFPLLLLGSEVLSTWRHADQTNSSLADSVNLPGRTPQILRMLASFALIFGVLTTLYQAALVRFAIPLHELQLRVSHNDEAGKLPQKMYTSAIGYAKLDVAIPENAVVQYNPWSIDAFWLDADWLGIKHQSVVDSDQDVCGAEFGGNPSACPAMAKAVDALYKDATADQARSTCHQYGIQYLVARIYDPVWSYRSSWVWTLNPVVSDEEFRVLKCR